MKAPSSSDQIHRLLFFIHIFKFILNIGIIYDQIKDIFWKHMKFFITLYICPDRRIIIHTPYLIAGQPLIGCCMSLYVVIESEGDFTILKMFVIKKS